MAYRFLASQKTMGIFDLMEEDGHEELFFCYNPHTQLKAIIAIHNTTLGKAIGGCRLWRYKSEKEALIDALKLSEITTYQSAICDSDTGGGKVVLLQESDEKPDEAYYRALGRFIQGFNGRFITYPDLGTGSQEMKYIKRETDHVMLHEASPTTAESSELTAYGVYWGMKACVKELFGVSSLDDLTVAIQGIGAVGIRLVDFLKQENVKLIVTDLNYDSIKAVQDRYADAEIVSPEEILTVKCDILSPCAMGPVITKDNIDQLRCKIVAGAAYNILEDKSLAEVLHQKQILCAPDFVINAGEMFLTEDFLRVVSREEALAAVKKIYDLMAKILTISKKQNISPCEVAHTLAQERIRRVGGVKSILC